MGWGDAPRLPNQRRGKGVSVGGEGEVRSRYMGTVRERNFRLALAGRGLGENARFMKMGGRMLLFWEKGRGKSGGNGWGSEGGSGSL